MKLNKDTLNYYITRDAELKVIENSEDHLAEVYDSALQSIVTLSEKVAGVEEGEGKNFWETNLKQLRRLFPLLETLSSHNTRMRGALRNIQKDYSEVLLKYRELEEKYIKLTELKM